MNINELVAIDDSLQGKAATDVQILTIQCLAEYIYYA